MIVTLIYNILSPCLEFINLLSPEWDLPVAAYDMLYDLAVFVYGFNAIFPISTLIACICAAMIFEFSILFIRLAVGVVSLIRGGGSIDI